MSFPNFIPFLISDFILLWSENFFIIISVLLKWSRLVSCPDVGSAQENVACALEEPVLWRTAGGGASCTRAPSALQRSAYTSSLGLFSCYVHHQVGHPNSHTLLSSCLIRRRQISLVFLCLKILSFHHHLWVIFSVAVQLQAGRLLSLLSPGLTRSRHHSGHFSIVSVLCLWLLSSFSPYFWFSEV